MIYLKTTRPCVASGDPSYRWDTVDDVVPVDDVTAGELLALKGAGFYEVPGPELSSAPQPPTPDPTPDPAAADPVDADDVTSTTEDPDPLALAGDPVDDTDAKPARTPRKRATN